MIAALPLTLSRLRHIALVRYLFASVGALAVDLACFAALLAAGLAPMAASALGYAVGIAAHWLFSSRMVFADQVAANVPDRILQQAMFVGSALIGLGLTTLTVGALSAAGLDPRLAKLAAIAFSFVATWLLRKCVVFR